MVEVSTVILFCVPVACFSFVAGSLFTAHVVSKRDKKRARLYASSLSRNKKRVSPSPQVKLTDKPMIQWKE